jgi:hypothetical protein
MLSFTEQNEEKVVTCMAGEEKIYIFKPKIIFLITDLRLFFTDRS